MSDSKGFHKYYWDINTNKRWVNVSEAIDSGDASFLDNTEYHETDAVPLNAALPTAHYLVDEVEWPS